MNESCSHHGGQEEESKERPESEYILVGHTPGVTYTSPIQTPAPHTLGSDTVQLINRR